MSFGLRSGGFSSGQLNPFGTGSGGFGQYNIGTAANEEASLDKYAATVAWQQGRLDDDDYIKALETYRDTTSKDSRERISAEDDLQDARYTIARNEIVNRLNNETSTSRRISAWQDLISVDRRRLRTMTAGDNEQRRELLTRIDDQEGNIRKESWSEQVRRYNRDRSTVDQMLRAARRMANGSVGSKDHQDWLDQVDEWTGRRDDETQNELMAEWQKHPTRGGNSVLRFLDERLSRTREGSPAFNQLRDQREQVAKSIKVAVQAEADGKVETRYATDGMSDEAYLQYWAKRLKDSPSGTDERRQLKVKVYNLTFKVSENKARREFDATGDPTQLLDVWTTAQVGMNKGTSRWMELQNAILELQRGAYGTLDLLRAEPSPQGHYVGSGAPPRGPGASADGFASQFDGSEFASVNCGYTAAAMLAWSAGVTGLSGGQMRWYSGDDRNSSYISGITTAMERVGLGLQAHNGMSLDVFRRRVANGEGSVVAGLYANLPDQYALSSFGGAHSVFVNSAKKVDGKWWYYVMDPIGRSVAQGAKWWPEEVMRKYAWSGATNPTSGTRLFGSVSFATKNGKSTFHRNPVPFQAFDTDAYGRDTRGKGGGTSRREAGYMPPAWADRARGKKRGTATDHISVQTFLGAIASAVGPDGLPKDEQEEADWVRRATTLLERYDGDVRMAGAQWFNKVHTDADSGTWSDRQRFYANKVGKQFGLPAVPPEGIGVIDPGAPAPPAVGATPGTGSLTPDVTGTRPLTEQDPGSVTNVAPDGSVAADPQVPPDAVQTDSLLGYSDKAVDIGRRFLAAIGAEQTPDNIRSVIAVMAASNGGVEKISELNPFNLRTDQPGYFPGQTGVENGQPVFTGSADPMQDAIEAAAQDILQNYPSIAGAYRTGNPESVLKAYDTTGYDDSAFGANRGVHQFNELPGNKKIYGLDTHLNVPSSIADQARAIPDLVDLMNIDPTDDLQWSWFKRNLANLREANTAGLDHWMFEAVDGSEIRVEGFDPSLLIEVADNGYQHARQLASLKHAVGDTSGANAVMDEAIAELSLSDMTFEGAKRIWDDLGAEAEKAGTAGDTYAIYARRQALIAQITGSTVTTSSAVGPNGVPYQQTLDLFDPKAVTNPMLDAEDIGKFAALVESDANNPYLYLRQPGVDGSVGINADGLINPLRGFVSMTRDAKGVAHKVPHVDTLEPDLFTMVDQRLPDGSKAPSVPAYLANVPGAQRKWVAITSPSGERIYQELQKVPAETPVTFYSNTPTSAKRAASNQALPGQENLGPMETRNIAGQAEGIVFIDVPDPTDPEGQRWMRYYTNDLQTWVGVPQGQLPSFVYRGAGTLGRDPDTNALTINNQPIDPAAWGTDFGIYGVTGVVAGGTPGVGAPDRGYIIRQTGPDGSLQTNMTAGERYSLGGDFYPKGLPAPTRTWEDRFESDRIRDRTQVDPTRVDQFGRTLPPGVPTAAEAFGDTEPRRSGGSFADEGEILGPPAPDVPAVPMGAPRSSDITRFLGRSANYLTQSLSLVAQNARNAANASALTARNEQLAREASARARELRVIAAQRQQQRVTLNTRQAPRVPPPVSTSRAPSPTPRPIRQSEYVPRPPRMPAPTPRPVRPVGSADPTGR